MYPSVQDAFLLFSTRFEGHVPYMYLDIKGLVTIGVGNLIDPVDLALMLPFISKSDLTPASEDDIRAEWLMVKGRQDLAIARDMLQQFAALTTFQLSDTSIDQLVLTKLESNETTLKDIPEFADLDDWPADGQLGLFSIAWAAGPDFASGNKFPRFRAACASKDWNTAAIESHLDDTNNPGLRRRNEANRILFSNAAQVVQQGLDFSIVQYSKDLSASKTALPVITELNPATGSPGDTVIITGQAFTGAFSVGFDVVSVPTMNVDSDTQITVTVPAGSGTVPVTVITPIGSSAPSPAAEFAYV